MNEKYSTWEFVSMSFIISSLILKYYGVELSNMSNLYILYYAILGIALAISVVLRVEKRLFSVFMISILPAALITILTNKLATLAFLVFFIVSIVSWIMRFRRLKKIRVAKITRASSIVILKGIYVIAYFVIAIDNLGGVGKLKPNKEVEIVSSSYIQEETISDYDFSYDTYFDYVEKFGKIDEDDKILGLNYILENEMQHLGIEDSVPQIEFSSFEVQDGGITMGQYSWGDNMIVINRELLNDGLDSIIKVLLHETCHFYQRKLLEDLEGVDSKLIYFSDVKRLRYEVENYKSVENSSFDEYKAQYIEIMADNYTKERFDDIYNVGFARAIYE